MPIFRLRVVRHDKRPRRKRHELPRKKKSECVVSKEDDVHAGQEGGIKRQDATSRVLVRSIAQRIKAGSRRSEVDDAEKQSREAIEAEVRSKPRQANRKS